ncbi:RINT1-like protein MAG2 [Linum perenne]
MESTLTLPPSAILSSSVVTFLNGRFNDQQDLEQASAIVSELQSQCVDLDQSLTAINSRIQSSLLAYASFSDRIHSLFTDTTSKLTDLGSLTSASSSFSGVKEQVLAEELPALAKEVSRVEIVRAYAAIACQRHFTKWTDKPEFIFALVYKITRDYVDTMDELLQPLVDEARLVGYEDRNLQKISSLSVFCDKPDWLDFWAEIELSDTLEKLKAEVEDERNWIVKEIRKLEYFRKEWVEKVSVVLLRGFESRCREYLKNKRQWQDRMEEGWPVSKNLVESLDYLQAKMAVVEENMNSIDFVSVWRSLASGIDRSLFNGVFTSNVKFYDSGVESLGRDMEVVFGVFGAWCIRAEGFFPKMSEGLKLLKKKNEEKGDEKWMKEKGIRHLGMAEAEMILKSRVFGS